MKCLSWGSCMIIECLQNQSFKRNLIFTPNFWNAVSEDSIVASIGSDSVAVGMVAVNVFSYPLTVTKCIFDMVISQTVYDTTSWLLELMQRDTCGIVQNTTLIYNWFMLPLTLRCMPHIWPRAGRYSQKSCYFSLYHLISTFIIIFIKLERNKTEELTKKYSLNTTCHFEVFAKSIKAFYFRVPWTMCYSFKQFCILWQMGTWIGFKFRKKNTFNKEKSKTTQETWTKTECKQRSELRPTSKY